MTAPTRPSPPEPPATIAQFVAVLGPELTVRFLLTFGGAELVASKCPSGGSRLVELVGRDKARALGELTGGVKVRIPLAKRWIARQFAWEGHGTAEIARRLHVADVSVRRWVRDT